MTRKPLTASLAARVGRERSLLAFGASGPVEGAQAIARVRLKAFQAHLGQPAALEAALGLLDAAWSILRYQESAVALGPHPAAKGAVDATCWAAIALNQYDLSERRFTVLANARRLVVAAYGCLATWHDDRTPYDPTLGGRDLAELPEDFRCD